MFVVSVVIVVAVVVSVVIVTYLQVYAEVNFKRQAATIKADEKNNHVL